jgi:hypothetical protein
VEDAAQPGHAHCIVTLVNISAVCRLICKNCHIKVEEFSEELNISIGSVHSIVHKEHGFNKGCVKWVLWQFTDDMKQQHVDANSVLLS